MINEETYTLLLNGMPFREFIVYYVVALAGALMFLCANFYKAIKVETDSPMQWSWRYVLKGGLRGVMSVVSLAFGIIYFGEISLIVFSTDTPVELNGLSAFLLGVGVDRLWKTLLHGGADTGKYLKRKMKNGTN